MPRKPRPPRLSRTHRRHGDEPPKTTMIRSGGPDGTVGFLPGAPARGLGAQLFVGYQRRQMVVRAIEMAQARNDESLEWDPHAPRWGEEAM